MNNSFSKPLVKLSSITNLHDARYGAGMGVDMLGFCLSSQSPNFISEDVFVQISGWITGIDIVLELEGTELGDLAQKILTEKEHPISYLQTDHSELVQSLEKYDLPVILKVSSFAELEKLGSLPAAIKFILLDNQEGKINLEQLQQLSAKYPLILENGITSQTITSLLSDTQLTGIAFKGGKEEQVGYGGYQDFDEISDILEILEDSF